MPTSAYTSVNLLMNLDPTISKRSLPVTRQHFRYNLTHILGLPKTTNEAQTQARKSGQNGASTRSVNLLTLGFLLAYLLI